MLKRFVIVVCLFMSLPLVASDNAVLVLGDSLSASHDIPWEAGWVNLLRARLAAQGYRHEVVNASISGETTQGAYDRLDDILDNIAPRVTIVELGGNDGLRGAPPEAIKANLTAIIDKLVAAGSRVLLVEMRLPPNYGAEYIDRFVSVYQELSVRPDVSPTQFILNGVAGNADLMQSDGIHPTAEAQEIMLDNIWPDLRSLLRRRNDS